MVRGRKPLRRVRPNPFISYVARSKPSTKADLLGKLRRSAQQPAHLSSADPQKQPDLLRRESKHNKQLGLRRIKTASTPTYDRRMSSCFLLPEFAVGHVVTVSCPEGLHSEHTGKPEATGRRAVRTSPQTGSSSFRSRPWVALVAYLHERLLNGPHCHRGGIILHGQSPGLAVSGNFPESMHPANGRPDGNDSTFAGYARHL